MSVHTSEIDLPSPGTALLDGKIVTPEHAGFDEARRAWNLTVDQQPDVRPTHSVHPQNVNCGAQMNTEAITIRPAYADDYRALIRLAALDSADAPPAQPLLLAEVDGQLRVALSLRDGSVIADPFFPTAAIIALLRGHSRALEPRPATRRLVSLSARWRGAAARERLA